MSSPDVLGRHSLQRCARPNIPNDDESSDICAYEIPSFEVFFSIAKGYTRSIMVTVECDSNVGGSIDRCLGYRRIDITGQGRVLFRICYSRPFRLNVVVRPRAGTASVGLGRPEGNCEHCDIVGVRTNCEYPSYFVCGNAPSALLHVCTEE